MTYLLGTTCVGTERTHGQAPGFRADRAAKRPRGGSVPWTQTPSASSSADFCTWRAPRRSALARGELEVGLEVEVDREDDVVISDHISRAEGEAAGRGHRTLEQLRWRGTRQTKKAMSRGTSVARRVAQAGPGSRRPSPLDGP
mmetsp:Transcript_10300/g.20234  ORF Transcript_10300/g.20234 Transcript_10300/m.20234 type:complete len:143 (-) Transcript_10300:1079-1507(-)